MRSNKARQANLEKNTLEVEYGTGRLAPRLLNLRVGPEPEARPRPLELLDPDFLLFLMISSSDISKALDIFV